MNKRSREILSQLITKNEYGQTVTMKDLMEKFQVSSRTIRYDIEQINDYLSKNHLEPLNLERQGVIKTALDIRKARELLMEEGFYSFKLSKKDRLAFTAVLLICADDYITLAEIADQLFVSRSTVIQDLENIKKFFQKQQLFLISHSNKGLLLEGMEVKKRSLLFRLIQSDSSIFKELPVLHHIIESISKNTGVELEDRTVIEKILNEAEHVYGRFWTDDSFLKLRNYLELSIYRLKKGHYVEIQEEKNSKWDMAKGILGQIEQFIVKDIPDSEVYFLTRVLNSLKYIKKETSNKEIVKMQVITRSFINNISNDIGINLQGDYIFYENLINHLESTFSTVNNTGAVNSVVNQILHRYPEVKSVTKRNVSIFEEYIGRKLSDDEIAYIVVHICASIERNRNETIRYSVILVCNGGIGTSQLLLARLEKFFRLNVLDIIPVHDIKNMNLDNVDIVISTIALDNWGIEYIQVDPLLNDEDCIRVGEKLSKIKPKLSEKKKEVIGWESPMDTIKRIKEILEESQDDLETLKKLKRITDSFFEKKHDSLTDFLPSKAIRLNVECSDWMEAIRKSAEYLLEQGAIKPEYVEAMIENVKENGPYIVVGPGFALPHEALDAGAVKVGMSLIQLKTPVPFGREGLDPVEWVCCLSAINKETHLKAMFHLINLFNNRSFREDIKKSATREEVFGIIERYEYEMR